MSRYRFFQNRSELWPFSIECFIPDKKCWIIIGLFPTREWAERCLRALEAAEGIQAANEAATLGDDP